MKRMIAFASNRPWLVLLLVTIITAIAAMQLDKLRINISAEGMMVKDDPARTFYEENQQIFGSDSPTIVLLRDPASRIHQPSSSRTNNAWTREQSGSVKTMSQSIPRPMRFASVGSSGKVVPAREPTVMVR